MQTNLRSLMFALKARDIELYLSNEADEHFVITRLVCSKCNTDFYPDLLECYFCGEINYYLFTCTKCKGYSSITGSSRVCRKCYPNKVGEKPTKKYLCTNASCVSNTNSEIKKIVISKDGVFKRGSGLNLSCTYCINCGSPRHEYKSFRVFLYDKEPFDSTNYQIYKDEHCEVEDLIILKKHENNQIKYGYEIIGKGTDAPNFDKTLDKIVVEILAYNQH